MLLRKLRTRMIAFLWLCIISFGGFIFLEWGMQYTSGRRMDKKERGIIAEVNKTPITSSSYSELVEYYSKQGLTNSEAEKEAFNKLVEDALVNEEIERKRIKIMDSEIIDFIKDNPPPQFLNDTVFQTDGIFDYNKYLSIISNPSNLDWLRNYELMLRSQLPRQVLYQIITGAVRPTTLDFMEEFLQRRTKIKVEYAVLEPEVKLSDLQNYYNKNKNEFFTDKSPVVNYVKFPIKLTPEDEAYSKDEAQEIFNSLSQGVPVDTIIEKYMCSVLAERPDGSGIIKKDDGWQISVKKDTIEVSILLPLRPSTETIAKVQEEAESFMESVRAAKSDFAGIAASNELEIKTGKINTPPLNELELSYLNLNKKGKLIGPIEGADVFYVLQTSGAINNEIKDFSEIESKVKTAYLKEQVKTFIVGDFKQFVTSEGLSINTTNVFSFENSPVNGDFFMQAVNIPKDSTRSILVDGLFYIVHCLDKITPNPDSFRSEIPQFYSTWIDNENKQIITDWVNSLKVNARIQDFRYKIY